jgi:hypothetical protein
MLEPGELDDKFRRLTAKLSASPAHGRFSRGCSGSRVQRI